MSCDKGMIFTITPPRVQLDIPPYPPELLGGDKGLRTYVRGHIPHQVDTVLTPLLRDDYDPPTGREGPGRTGGSIKSAIIAALKYVQIRLTKAPLPTFMLCPGFGKKPRLGITQDTVYWPGRYWNSLSLPGLRQFLNTLTFIARPRLVYVNSYLLCKVMPDITAAPAFSFYGPAKRQ